MWLLSTDRAELKYFSAPEDVPEGYAILSHVWDAHEQTFQDVKALAIRYSRGNPRDYASPKIRESCILAEKHGYRWIWNDTCCIDKTSSAELSEAINSMYLYYSLAEICYAYLRDVPRDCILGEPDSAFRTSRWHQRGWTLQELIAPSLLVFLSQDWQILGTKSALAKLLAEVTEIPVDLLRLTLKLPNIPVAQRMSWAARRQTTRIEDQAYCLLGIFGINMPTLYGEGKQAFMRLQEEIMRNYADTTMFAWGLCYTGRIEHVPGVDDPRYHRHEEGSYLFAPSPSVFEKCGNIYFDPPHLRFNADYDRFNTDGVWRGGLYDGENAMQQEKLIPSFSITPYGVLARVPVIRLRQITVAVLFWVSGKQRLGLIIANCPRRRPEADHYDIGLGDNPHIRLVPLSYHSSVDQYELFKQLVTHQWCEVYLAHRPPPGVRLDAVATLPIPMCLGASAPFRFRERSVEKALAQFKSIRFWPEAAPLEWTGFPPATFSFTDPSASWGMALQLGRCIDPSRYIDEERPADLGPHWAYVEFYYGGKPYSPPERHDCSKHHIVDWESGTKTLDVPETHGFFSQYKCTAITLSFSRCPLNPDGTIVVDVSLHHADQTASADTTSLPVHALTGPTSSSWNAYIRSTLQYTSVKLKYALEPLVRLATRSQQ